MDELLSPCSSFSPRSPSSMFSSGAAAAAAHAVLEFTSCEVPDEWLMGDVVVAKNEEDVGGGGLWGVVGGSLSPGSELSELPRSFVEAPAQRPAKRRGRKPGPRPDGPTVSHVEAERQRREKLNRRFCDLRAAVPTVSRMDKASLLADAAAYIGELRARVARLEADARQAAAARWEPSSGGGGGGNSSSYHAAASALAGLDEAVEVRMMGRDAATVRVTTTGARHAPARLMGALRSLELPVQHACVMRLHGVTTVQEVLVDVPAALQDDDTLRTALLQRLRDS
ncbi:transcription factor MYC2-like [Oryza brachyantha]|uniref:transcription factor MYC2-like n=1 Tax=Oryza brachyantha TaxID=4533 RepID=UPI001ADCA4DC|nr:transcription factor MYC2-like [Oryza brachyantha]